MASMCRLALMNFIEQYRLHVVVAYSFGFESLATIEFLEVPESRSAPQTDFVCYKVFAANVIHRIAQCV